MHVRRWISFSLVSRWTCCPSRLHIRPLNAIRVTGLDSRFDVNDVTSKMNEAFVRRNVETLFIFAFFGISFYNQHPKLAVYTRVTPNARKRNKRSMQVLAEKDFVISIERIYVRAFARSNDRPKDRPKEYDRSTSSNRTNFTINFISLTTLTSNMHVRVTLPPYHRPVRITNRKEETPTTPATYTLPYLQKRRRSIDSHTRIWVQIHPLLVVRKTLFFCKRRSNLFKTFFDTHFNFLTCLLFPALPSQYRLL